MTTTSAHVREPHSILAAAEKRLLVWLARRMPPWVTSDQLSALGLASMMAAGGAFAALRPAGWSAAAIVAALAANWLGDSLDGTLARVRDQQRPRYGFYVDHVIDVAGTACLLGGMACSAYMNPTIALALLAAYLLVSAESYLATHAVGVFRISAFGIGPTELRIILATGAVWVIHDPRVSLEGFGSVRLFDLGGIVALIGLTLAFVISAVRNTRALYRDEPLPRRGRKAA